MDGRRIILNTVGSVGQTPIVVVRKRQALHLLKQLASKAKGQALTSVLAHHPGSEPLQHREQADHELQSDHDAEEPGRRCQEGTRDDSPEEIRQWMIAEDAVDEKFDG
jgi:hypothetical protein